MTAAVDTRQPRPEKVAAVGEITQKLTGAGAVLTTEYRGLKVADLRKLRAALREKGAEYQVVKCTLARLAAAEAGLDVIVPSLVGPIALVFCGEDVPGAAKVLDEFSKENQTLVVTGGVLEGRAIGAADLKAIAELPSREVLLSQIAGMFEAPASQVAALFNAPLANVVGLVDALADKKGAA